MKQKISITTSRKSLKYKNHLIYRKLNYNGYWCAVYLNPTKRAEKVFICSTPYRNDIESAVEAAKNSIDYLIRTGRF